MPLHLIRQDLTAMDCDAIVNPSNVQLQPGGGLDAAIHRAAGPRMDDACRAIGRCPVGQAKETPGFDLPCRWVIHTAAPVWHGGLFGELRLLADCYRSCVERAQALACKTLAIPLLGAGNNRFPVKEVLPLAMQTLEDCLRETELTVYLVVFDKQSFALSETLRTDVQSYIDDHYAARYAAGTSGNRCTQLRNRAPESCNNADASVLLEAQETERNNDGAVDYALAIDMPAPDMHGAPGNAGSMGWIESAPAQPKKAAALPKADLNLLLQLDEPFAVKLLKLIDQKGMDDVACYKKANVSRQTWYKILNEKGYKPNKKTVLCFAVALELSLAETQMLLESVGFILSGSSMFDVILMYCLSHGVYDVLQIDAILFQYDQETLYSHA